MTPRSPIKLDLATGNERGPVFRQLGIAPLFEGTAPAGADYLCGNCSQLLCRSIPERTFHEVFFACSICGSESRAPLLEPSIPVPQKAVLVPNGAYRFDATVALRDAAIASQSALSRWRDRVGAAQRIFKRDPLIPVPDLDAATCERFLDQAQRLLASSYEGILASDARGLASHTPPGHRHRLAELLRKATHATQQLRSSKAGVDPFRLMELGLFVDLCTYWSCDPAWSGLTAALVNPYEFEHTFITLVLATFLLAHGNPTRIYAAAGRAADLRIDIGPTEHAAVEIKAPRSLQRPRDPLGRDEAIRIIEKARKKAGTGGGGQLGPGSNGILAVGGHGLSRGDLDELEGAAAHVLSGKARPQIAAISLVSIGSTIDMRPSGTMAPIFDVRVVRNPCYAGDLRLTSEALWDSPG